MDPAGNIDLAWDDNSAGYAAIFFSRSTDGGSNFSSPVNLSNNPLGTNSPPSINLDSNGNVYVVWVGGSTYAAGGTTYRKQDVFLCTSTDGGTTFSSPADATNEQPGFLLSTAQVVATSMSNINIIWEMQQVTGGSTWSINYRRSSDGGATFGSISSSADTGNTGSYPPEAHMALDATGAINVIWQVVQDSGPSYVDYARSNDGGNSFAVSNIVTLPNGGTSVPQLAIDASNNIDVLFQGSPSNGFGIFFTQSTDAGSSFSSAQNVSNDNGSGPQIALDPSGQTRIVWYAVSNVFFTGSVGLSSLSVSPASVSGGSSSTGTVTLGGPAPSGGAVISLSSSDPTVASVPGSMTIPEGATTATFIVTTSPVATSSSVTISASYSGATQTALLMVTPSTLTSLTLSPSSVTGGSASTGTVTLGAPAPSGGAVISLSSNNTGVATVPGNVTVAAGATSATFTVTTNPVSTSTPITISASYGGGTQTASLTVTASAVSLSSLTFSPSTVTGGSPSTGTVTLSGPAPSGGAVVSLSSSKTGVATVPGSVTVAGGSTTATFVVTTTPVGTSASVTLSASFNGVTRTTSLTVVPPTLTSLALSPSSVTGGSSSTGTVTLSGPAPDGGAVVSLSGSNAGVASVPGGVTVAWGSMTATFTVTTTPVGTSTSVTLSALLNGVTRTASLTVLPPTLTSLALSPSRVTAGGTSTGTVMLSGPAPSSGVVVSLSSSNTNAAAVPQSVTIPAGATVATFKVNTNLLVLFQTNVTISASYGGVTRTASITVVPLTGGLLGSVNRLL